VSSSPPSRERLRRVAAPALVVLSALCAFVSVFALWADRQAIESSGWRATSEALVANPQIQDALAVYLVDELYENVDVGSLVEDALPTRFDALAAPAAGALRTAIERAADEALQRPRVQAALNSSLIDSHALAVRILKSQSTSFETGDGTVVLNLRSVLEQVVARVGIGERLLGELPPDAGRVEILRSDQLATAQGILRLLENLAIVMPLLAVALLALAVWVAEGRRRETLRLAGIGFAVAALLVPVTRSLLGDIVIDTINPAPANLPAVEAAWEIATALLRDGAVALITYAIIILVGTTLAGPTRAAVAVRGGLRRVTAPQIAYPLAAVLVLVVLWWGPTEGLRRPLTALILLALLALGLETLRRQIESEALAEGAPAPRPLDLGGMAGSIAGAVTGVFRRSGGGAEEDRLAQLERAQRLHESGALTDDEFTAEKRRILDAD
jgi:uncharacterized membrane protein